MKMLKGQQLEFMSIIIAAVILIIGAITFAMVFNATGNGTFTENTTTTMATNFTYTVTRLPAVDGSASAINCSQGSLLVEDTDFRFEHTTGNFTIINGELDQTCEISVTYRLDRVPSDGTFDTSSELINEAANSSFDLVAVALIILAALIILSVVFLLGRRA